MAAHKNPTEAHPEKSRPIGHDRGAEGFAGGSRPADPDSRHTEIRFPTALVAAAAVIRSH